MLSLTMYWLKRSTVVNASDGSSPRRDAMLLVDEMHAASSDELVAERAEASRQHDLVGRNGQKRIAGSLIWCRGYAWR